MFYFEVRTNDIVRVKIESMNHPIVVYTQRRFNSTLNHLLNIVFSQTPVGSSQLRLVLFIRNIPGHQPHRLPHPHRRRGRRHCPSNPSFLHHPSSSTPFTVFRSNDSFPRRLPGTSKNIFLLTTQFRVESSTTLPWWQFPRLFASAVRRGAPLRRGGERAT